MIQDIENMVFTKDLVISISNQNKIKYNSKVIKSLANSISIGAKQ